LGAPLAGILSIALGYAEKVRSQFLSLRHMYLNLLRYFIYFEIDPRIDPQSGVFIWAVFKDLAN
jgi:hypothetical protein